MTRDDLVTCLREQDYYLGPYTNWQHMECDRSQDSITHWYVDRTTSQSGKMLPGASGTGC